MTSTPQPRPAIASLPAYVAGRPAPDFDTAVAPAGAVARLLNLLAIRSHPLRGRDRPRTYKLSSNENPFPPPQPILDAVATAATQVNRYPDFGCAELYAAIGEHLDLPVDWLVTGTGSVAVLYNLLQAFCGPGDEVVHAWRSFEAYPIAVNVAGATPVAVPLDASGRHDLDGMVAGVTARTRAVLLCTPNNPTGPALSHAEVLGVVERVPSDVLVVVDEAYREFVRLDDPIDGVALVRSHPNVVVLRTFAKAFGLAGLRVGYGIARPEIAAPVRACSLPFGVSTIAQAAAIAALDCAAELGERVDAIVAERDRVVAALHQQGWILPDTQGNFIWLPLGDRAVEFGTRAEEAGAVVRPFADAGVRVTIGEPAGNDLFLDVAGAFLDR